MTGQTRQEVAWKRANQGQAMRKKPAMEGYRDETNHGGALGRNTPWMGHGDETSQEEAW